VGVWLLHDVHSVVSFPSAMQAQQGEDIPDQVKRYRQSIFKLGG
jgi:hypothetical protein